jgi:hypothetical protein
MDAIKERLPELIILPAHDIRAFANIPRPQVARSSLDYSSKAAIPRALQYLFDKQPSGSPGRVCNPAP